MCPIGLDAVQGVKTVHSFYWDQNDATRAFGNRFSAAHPKKDMPNEMHAGMYGATLHVMRRWRRPKMRPTESSWSTR